MVTASPSVRTGAPRCRRTGPAGRAPRTVRTCRSPPVSLQGAASRLKAVTFEYTHLEDGRLTGTGETFTLAADMLFKAIGQTMSPLPQSNGGARLEMDGDRIAVGPDRRTSLPDVWAGGDCVAISEDLTVAAVQDGKLAAAASDGFLTGGNRA